MIDFLARLLARIPRRWLFAFGACLGWFAWALRIRRRVVLANLALAFPEKTAAERRAIARATYRNLGRMIPEFLVVPSLSREDLNRILFYDGASWQRFLEARSRGRGVIACTAHFGNFELLAAAHNLRGVPITMIARRMGASRANDLWRATRARAGVEELTVTKGDTLRAAMRSLRQGRVLGYVIDQNQPLRRAIFPSFFGVPAATSATPAYLAMRTGAATLFVVAIPEPDGRHRVVVEGPLFPPDTGDRERDALAFVQDLNDRLERYVRLYPDRWYWLHRRWKTRPGPCATSPEASRATSNPTATPTPSD